MMVPMDRLLRAAWAGTAVFAISAAAAVAVEDALIVSVTVALVLFALGIVAFGAGFLRAVGRSRTEVVSLGGLFFLSGSAPKAMQRQFLGAIAVQTMVALVTASIRPFTGLAFGILVPVFGLGLLTLWASRHATFPPRKDEKRPSSPSSSTLATEQSEHHESSD